jgi:hypothetical protein
MLFKNTVEKSTLEILEILQGNPMLKDFHLAGGTALALQIGHRKSIDLDMFTLHDFDVNTMLEFLEQKFDFYSDYTSTNTIKGSIDSVKIDFIAHKYQHVESIIETEGVRLYSIPDIAAMKLNAIAGNGTRSKDFVDVYFMLKIYKPEQLLNFYMTKYHQRNVMHILKSLVYFDDINTSDWPVMVLEKDLKLSDVKKEILSAVKKYSEQLI